jgi:hypothetical protein
MVVGEGPCGCDDRARLTQRLVELARAANAGEGQHAPSSEPRRNGRIRHEVRHEHRHAARARLRGDRLPALARSDHESGVDLCPLPLGRRAEWSCGQHATIAEPGFPVEHGQAHVLAQGWVLEAVIHDDAVRAERDRQRRPCHPVARHDRRPGAREKQRLVADVA